MRGFVLESMQGKFAKGGVQGAGADFFNQRLNPAAVFDQVGNGTNLEAVLRSKQLQVGQARHGAVVFHDLANHGGRAAAGHGSQVASGFGVTRSHQHTAFDGLQRENVSGLHQVVGTGVFGHCGLHCAGPVGRGDAGSHPFSRFDRHSEGGAFFVAVAHRHGCQFQSFTALAGERQANQAAPKTRHEIDRFSADMVCRQHQIAFILAVFFINQNHDPTRTHVGHDVFNGGNCHRGEDGHAGVFQKNSDKVG